MVWKEKYHSRPTALPKASPEIWYLKMPPRLTAPIELDRVKIFAFSFVLMNIYYAFLFRSLMNMYFHLMSKR